MNEVEIPEDIIRSAHAVYAEVIEHFGSFQKSKALFAIADALMTERNRCASLVSNYQTYDVVNEDGAFIRRDGAGTRLAALLLDPDA